MITPKGHKNDLLNIISLLVVYLTVMVLILVFADRFLRNPIPDDSDNNFLIIFGVALPAFLLGLLVVNVVRLTREWRLKNPGSPYKIKITLFFSFIAAICSITQGFFSFMFINSVLRSVYSTEFSDAIDGGVDLALRYYRETADSLDSLAKSSYLADLAENWRSAPDDLWLRLQDYNALLDSFQIFYENGDKAVFLGDQSGFLVKAPSPDSPTGILPRADSSNQLILRSLGRVKIDGLDLLLVFSSILPPDFDNQAQALDDTRHLYAQYRQVRSDFSTFTMLIYSFFASPLLLLAILIAFFLAEQIMRPLTDLERAIRSVAAGDFSVRIGSHKNHELNFIASSFNHMITELEITRQTISQSEKLTAWQEVARRLAHEIRNPLTPIKLAAQRLGRRHAGNPRTIDDILPDTVRLITAEVDSMDRMLTEFRDLVRMPAPKIAAACLGDLIKEVIQIYGAAFPAITFDANLIDAKLIIHLDREQIKQVLSNLIKNSCEAMNRKGLIKLQNDLVRKGNSGYCRIKIQDNGPGIAADKQAQVFNPYFTTKDRGTGLGLAIVERIVYDHQGRIWLESQVGFGAAFYIDLPIVLPIDLPTKEKALKQK